MVDTMTPEPTPTAVAEFLRLVAEGRDENGMIALIRCPTWLDGNYDHGEASEALARKNSIELADWPTWRTLFTAHYRRDHFGAGRQNLRDSLYRRFARRLAEIFPGENAG